METESKKRFLTDISYYAVISAIIYFIFSIGFSYLLPFFIAFVISAISHKICKKIKISGVNENICAVFTAVIIYLSALLLCVLAVRALFSYKSDIASAIIKYTGLLIKTVERYIKPVKKYKTFYKALSGSVIDTSASVITSISAYIAEFIAKIPWFLIEIAVTVTATVYITKDYDKLKKFFSYFLKPDTKERLSKIKIITFETLKKFVGGYAILFLLTFSELALVFFILKIPYFIFVAFIVSFIDILPILGVGTILLPWSAISFLNGKISFGIALISAYLIITVIRNFAEPHIIGKKFRINPIFTLVAMFIGIKAGGIYGALLLPFALAVIVKYYKNQMENEII